MESLTHELSTGEKSMATSESKASYWLKTSKEFLNAFRRSKRGLVGVGIIVFFAFIASAASLLTPYDPATDKWLAGRGTAYHARPAWFRYLPGGKNLTENVEPIVNPSFTAQSSLNEWNFTTTSASAHHIFLQHISSIGATGGNPGCVAITYKRGADEEPPTVPVKASIAKQFQFPYDGPPAQFSCEITVLTEGVEDVPVEVRVFIERLTDSSEHKKYEWGIGTRTTMNPLGVITFQETSTRWITPADPIISTLLVNKSFTSPEKEVFSKPGEYLFGVETLFKDSNPGKKVEATVYLDNINIKVFGTAFGLLGCDYCGRDIFSQIVYGARISLYVGLLSAGVSVSIGLILGLVSAYVGGAVDEILMRFTDAILVLPGLPLMIVLVAVLGASVSNLIILIGFLGWMGFARVVRSQVLSLKERPYIEAAKAVGAGMSHIIIKHILPNVLGLVYVSLAMAVPSAITIEASLSWLGFYDPYSMSWGRMLYDVQYNHGYLDFWWVIPPGICIALISVAFILLGYALDDILNPKLRVRR